MLKKPFVMEPRSVTKGFFASSCRRILPLAAWIGTQRKVSREKKALQTQGCLWSGADVCYNDTKRRCPYAKGALLRLWKRL